MPYGPGKFESEGFETFALCVVSLNGFEDESIGSVDELGWYGLFRGPIDVEDDSAFVTDLESEVSSSGYTEDEIREGARALHHMAGAILSEDSNGFEHADIFETAEDLDAAWAAIEADYMAFDGGDDDV